MKIKHIETLLDETQLSTELCGRPRLFRPGMMSMVEYEDGFEEIFEAEVSQKPCNECVFFEWFGDEVTFWCGIDSTPFLKKCGQNKRIDKQPCIWIRHE